MKTNNKRPGDTETNKAKSTVGVLFSENVQANFKKDKTYNNHIESNSKLQENFGITVTDQHSQEGINIEEIAQVSENETQYGQYFFNNKKPITFDTRSIVNLQDEDDFLDLNRPFYQKNQQQISTETPIVINDNLYFKFNETLQSENHNTLKENQHLNTGLQDTNQNNKINGAHDTERVLEVKSESVSDYNSHFKNDTQY